MEFELGRGRVENVRASPDVNRVKERLKGAVHPLVRDLPRAARKSLYLASHASRIMEWSVPDSRLLLRALTEHATQAQFVYIATNGASMIRSFGIAAPPCIAHGLLMTPSTAARCVA